MLITQTYEVHIKRPQREQVPSPREQWFRMQMFFHNDNFKITKHILSAFERQLHHELEHYS